MNSSSSNSSISISISTLSSTSSSFSDLFHEPTYSLNSQTLTSSLSSSSSLTKKNMVFFKGAPSPRSVVITSTSMFGYDSLSDIDEPALRHFLDSCFLCNKPLSGHKDIFMYSGDKPFCSEDCRQKQMDFDDKIIKEQQEINIKIKLKSFYSSSSSSSSSSSFKSCFQTSSSSSSLIINHEENTSTTTNASFWT